MYKIYNFTNKYFFYSTTNNTANTAQELRNANTGISEHQTKANKWVKRNLIWFRFPTKLLQKIATNKVKIPTDISLHLVLKSLIKHGANMHAKENRGMTPLHQASTKGHLEMVKLLIEHGADLSVKNNYGNTPLHLASFKGYFEIAQLLIEKGEDVNTKNNYGRTPLELASEKGYLEIAKLLILISLLDKNVSIDYLPSFTLSHFSSDTVKNYYNENKEQIDSLIKQRKYSQLALSIVHNPYNVVIPDNFDKEKIITYSLGLMKVNNRLGNLPSLSSFPVKENSQWNFLIEDFQFISLQDLGKLAQVNKEFRDALSLIRQNDVIQILIRSNQYRLAN